MHKSLVKDHIIPESPLWMNNALNDFLNVDLIVKRDDLFPYALGGNKARKMLYLVRDAERIGANAIITAGSIQSNHARVVALTCAERQWHCSILYHTPRKNISTSGNNLIVKLSGAEIKKIRLENAREEMDAEMSRLVMNGLTPFAIYGGGHSTTGTFAYYDAVTELKNQLLQRAWAPEYIVVPVGTGTTHAGVHCGSEDQFPETVVFGVSISRKRKRSLTIAKECINDFNRTYRFGKQKKKKLFIFDNWIGKGYESVYPELVHFISSMAKNFGLMLDPTYSGKTFLGLKKLIEKKKITPGSKVVYWHTGGILNLIAGKSFTKGQLF